MKHKILIISSILLVLMLIFSTVIIGSEEEKEPAPAPAPAPAPEPEPAPAPEPEPVAEPEPEPEPVFEPKPEPEWQPSGPVVQPDTDTINWDEAANYIGADTTVCGKIKDVSAVKIPDLVLMMGGKLGKGIGIEVIDGTYDGNLRETFIGQTICVSGVITDLLMGDPLIIVKDTSQVEILEPEPEPEGSVVATWEEAMDYVDVEVTVCGPIIDNVDIGTAMLLGMGTSGTVAGGVGIELDYGILADLPEDLYVGQEICVTGMPYVNPVGGASIVVSDPSQITMPGEAAAGGEGEAAGMSWEEAASYIGEEITVCGPIIDTMDIGGPVLLGMGASAADSATVGIEIVITLLAEMPEDMYVGQTICVTGVPYTNPYGGANITVNDLSQIVVQE